MSHRRTKTGPQSMLATLCNLWEKTVDAHGLYGPGMPKKCTETSAPQSNEWHNLKGREIFLEMCLRRRPHSPFVRPGTVVTERLFLSCLQWWWLIILFQISCTSSMLPSLHEPAISMETEFNAAIAPWTCCLYGDRIQCCHRSMNLLSLWRQDSMLSSVHEPAVSMETGFNVAIASWTCCLYGDRKENIRAFKYPVHNTLVGSCLVGCRSCLYDGVVYVWIRIRFLHRHVPG